MKNALPDRRLNDYLDGRMTEDERAEFERSCEHDEELARRLESYREMRDALLSPEPEPGPEFYARARERFATGSASRRVGLHGLLSWEAAGLAAAVVLAAVVFLPTMIGMPVPDRVGPIPETGTLRADDPKRIAAVAAEGDAETQAARSAPKGEGRAVREKKGKSADHRILAPGGSVIEPGAVLTIDTQEAWNERFAGRPGLLPDGFRFRAGSRWIVLGPRTPPIACRSIAIVTQGGFREILLPAPAEDSDRWGCIVIVPADDLEFRVTETHGGR
jgi:hypothetical protein